MTTINEPFDMILARSDEEVFRLVVAMGIDSHLEGLTETIIDREQGNILGNRLSVTVGPKDIPIVLRRLDEIANDGRYCEEDDDDCIAMRAERLRDDIIYVMNDKEE